MRMGCAKCDIVAYFILQECDLGQQSVLHAVQLVHRAVADERVERTASESEPLNKTINKILDGPGPEPTAGEHSDRFGRQKGQLEELLLDQSRYQCQ